MEPIPALTGWEAEKHPGQSRTIQTQNRCFEKLSTERVFRELNVHQCWKWTFLSFLVSWDIIIAFETIFLCIALNHIAGRFQSVVWAHHTISWLSGWKVACCISIYNSFGLYWMTFPLPQSLNANLHRRLSVDITELAVSVLLQVHSVTLLVAVWTDMMAFWVTRWNHRLAFSGMCCGYCMMGTPSLWVEK